MIRNAIEFQNYNNCQPRVCSKDSNIGKCHKVSRLENWSFQTFPVAPFCWPMVEKFAKKQRGNELVPFTLC